MPCEGDTYSCCCPSRQRGRRKAPVVQEESNAQQEEKACAPSKAVENKDGFPEHEAGVKEGTDENTSEIEKYEKTVDDITSTSDVPGKSLDGIEATDISEVPTDDTTTDHDEPMEGKDDLAKDGETNQDEQMDENLENEESVEETNAEGESLAQEEEKDIVDEDKADEKMKAGKEKVQEGAAEQSDSGMKIMKYLLLTLSSILQPKPNYLFLLFFCPARRRLYVSTQRS